MIANLWARLTSAHSSITDVEQRRQSTLLASFILVILLGNLLSLVNAYIGESRSLDYRQLLLLASLLHVPSALLSYYLNRIGKFRASAIVYISVLFLILHSVLPIKSAPMGIMSFDASLLLMGSILLSMKENLTLVVASIMWQVLMSVVAPKTTLVLTSDALIINLIVAGIVLVSVQHRTRLERERHAEVEATLMALHESEEKFRTIFEAAPYAITINSLDGRFTAVNAAFLDIVGFSRQQILGRTPDEIGLIRDPTFMRQVLEKLQARAQMTNYEMPIFRADGCPLNMLYSNRILQFSQDTCVLTFSTDLTERKRAETALAKERKLLRTVIDHLPDNIFVKDRDGRFVLNNTESLRILGVARQEEVLGKTDFDFFPPDQAAEWRVFEQTIMQSGQPILDVEESQPWREDRRRWITESTIPMYDEGGDGIGLVGISRDITERKRLEAELERHTDRLELIVEERTTELTSAKEQIEAILDNIGDGIALLQQHGDIQATNPAFKALFGDRVGAAIEDVLGAFSDTEQMAAVAEALVTAVIDRQSRSVEARIRSAGGEELDVEVDVIAFAENNMSSTLLSVHNITHLKELERFNARFVANVVHDLSSPITALATRLYLLQKMPERLDEHARVLNRQTERLKELVTDLRGLSAIGNGFGALELEPINLNELIAQIVETYQPVCLGRNQLLSFLPRPDLPTALLDPGKCERVVVNLITNSISYSPEYTKIRILTQVEGDSIVLTVSDEGIGIAAEDLPHIFERFYRTDKARIMHSSGTGLGLPIVKEIVEAHGGTIRAESEVNKGSKFDIRFPLQSARQSVQLLTGAKP